MNFRSIIKKIKQDLFLKSYRDTYFTFLSDIKSNGFKIVSLEESCDFLSSKQPLSKIAGLRHDVDTHNIAGNRMFLEVEKSVGATATYYFRKKTAKSHKRFINELLENGFKVGYHFEEGSYFAKRYKTKSKQELSRYSEEIKLLFKENVEKFRQEYNPNIRSVCAHGDWINRKLNFINYDFIDQKLLDQCRIDFEAYKSEIFNRSQEYITDTAMEACKWDYKDSLKLKVLCILTHERQWYPGAISNIRENFVRIIETLAYKNFSLT